MIRYNTGEWKIGETELLDYTAISDFLFRVERETGLITEGTLEYGYSDPHFINWRNLSWKNVYGEEEEFHVPLRRTPATMVLRKETFSSALVEYFSAFLRLALTSHPQQSRKFLPDMYRRGNWKIYGGSWGVRENSYDVRNAVWTYTYGTDDDGFGIDISEVKEFLGDDYEKIRSEIEKGLAKEF